MQSNIGKRTCAFSSKSTITFEQSHCQEIITLIDKIQTTCLANRKHLKQDNEQTKMLQLFEPRFGPMYVQHLFLNNFGIFLTLKNRYEGKKNSELPKEHAESLRLRKKYKREFKSANRALALDSQFIAREELKQQMEKYIFQNLTDVQIGFYFYFFFVSFFYRDAQRKRKVKDIQAQLSMQEGEYRKLQKAK